MTAPALIISYSRYENVIRLIKDLQSQGVNRIYLAIDGAKDSNDHLQDMIETKSQSLAGDLNLELKIWRRLENLGPAVSVITAIDWFFYHETEGIILEDDLVLSPDAVAFFSRSLTKFAAEKSVFMISGSNYFDNIDENQSQLATHYPVIWGWATWEDRWKTYRDSLKDFRDIRVPGKFSDKWFWQNGSRRCLIGVKDAWDIPLAAFQLSIESLSVLPPVNLISNSGADKFAGNTIVDQWPLNVPVHRLGNQGLESLNSDSFVFNKDLVALIDKLFKKQVYGIHSTRTLPSQISKYFDILRYPSSARMSPLVQRINRVKIPT